MDRLREWFTHHRAAAIGGGVVIAALVLWLFTRGGSSSGSASSTPTGGGAATGGGTGGSGSGPDLTALTDQLNQLVQAQQSMSNQDSTTQQQLQAEIDQILAMQTSYRQQQTQQTYQPPPQQAPSQGIMDQIRAFYNQALSTGNPVNADQAEVSILDALNPGWTWNVSDVGQASPTILVQQQTTPGVQKPTVSLPASPYGTLSGGYALPGSGLGSKNVPQ